MNQTFQTYAMQAKDWKIPLNVAVAIHLLVFLGAIYLPGMFKSSPRFADIYTVSVINVAEPGAAPQAAAKSPKAASSAPKIKRTVPAKAEKTVKKAPPPAPVPPAAKKAVPLAEPAPAVEHAAPKAVSLKPLKKKIVQENKQLEEQAKKQEQQRKRELERQQELAKKQEIDRKQRLQRQKLAESLREEALLAEKARLAEEAVEAERKLLKASEQIDNAFATPARAATSSSESSSSAAAGGTSSLLMSQYLAAISSRVQQYWTPPEYLQQDPNLSAVVVITVNQDGTVANTLFESRSGNRIFDQFVSKTIGEAAPLPPIPPALKKQRFEIGLRFKPGSVGTN